MVIEIFWSPKGVQAYAIILEQKIQPHFPSWVMENFQSPSDGVDVLPFNKPPLSNGE